MKKEHSPQGRPSRGFSLGRAALVALVALAMAGGCVERTRDLSPQDRERVAPYLSTEAPSPQHALDVQLDRGIRLLGYDVSVEQATPGQSFTVTWHWHAEQNGPEGWQLFTHVADAAGESRLNQDQEGVVRQLYQPPRWRAGQYIRDQQEVTIPADWGSNQATFLLGLWREDHRLRIRSGPRDSENRIRAFTIDVAAGPSAAARPTGAPPEAEREPPPVMPVVFASTAPEIDGRLDEPAWGDARRTRRFVGTVDGSRAEPRASARVLWDREHLYVAFEVADDHLRSAHTERDAHLWDEDVVEVMLDPTGDGQNYFELQVSPAGVVFDTRYDSRRQPAPHGHVDWNSAVRTAVQVRGALNDEGRDEGYTVEMAIPWSAFATGDPPVSRPEPGQSWRANLYVMDRRPGDGGSRAVGWSPTYERDFHVPARFGRLTFQGEPQARVEQPGGPALDTPQLRLPPSALEAIRQDRDLSGRALRLRERGVGVPNRPAQP